MLSWVKSKRGSSTPCPGASRKSKSAGHSAQNDGALPIKLLRHHIESNLQRPRRAQRIPAASVAFPRMVMLVMPVGVTGVVGGGVVDIFLPWHPISSATASPASATPNRTRTAARTEKDSSS